MTGDGVRQKMRARAALVGLALGVVALAGCAMAGVSDPWAIGVLTAFDLLLLAACVRPLFGDATDQPGEPEPRLDSLTGLPDRRALTAVVERTLPVADSDQEPAGLLVFGVHELADVTDTLGPAIGDLLLKEVAARLAAAVRDTDTVGRLGDDEFAVLLPQVGSAPACLDTARRLLDLVRGPADLDGYQVRISAAVGAAVYPVHAATTTELFVRAETALRAASRSRDGAALYEVGVEGDLRPRKEIDSREHRPALPSR
ncbi:GGDEF domain-containing protein [Actinoplanes awajinensis]|uniref:GGDEF domain-containing protein n=1 Tax=Actinoplanes awajinensis subsp. mycoplanecinus TaxID=135947 RepID=A0A117MPV5_9ACTN|nr:GGDEF domain-containing protein [Actinoplanes awajinensis]KUL29262.1 hypothetical protein ADL15_29340 [Actinoplanes awajinensis subsp. mycoplanecinus]